MHCHAEAEPYAWPHDGSFSPATTAVLVIDMQRDFLEEGGYLTSQGYDHLPLREIIPNILSLCDRFQQEGFPIYFTRESHRPDLSTLSSREHARSRNNPLKLGIGSSTARLGRALIRGQLGCGLIDELSVYVAKDEVNVFDKPGRSAFAHTELELVLRNRGIRNLVICGVTTDVCVHSTLREANDRTFDCVVVNDATAAGTTGLHIWAIDSIKGEGGIFGSVTNTGNLLKCLGQYQNLT